MCINVQLRLVHLHSQKKKNNIFCSRNQNPKCDTTYTMCTALIGSVLEIFKVEMAKIMDNIINVMLLMMHYFSIFKA